MTEEAVNCFEWRLLTYLRCLDLKYLYSFTFYYLFKLNPETLSYKLRVKATLSCQKHKQRNVNKKCKQRNVNIFILVSFLFYFLCILLQSIYSGVGSEVNESRMLQIVSFNSRICFARGQFFNHTSLPYFFSTHFVSSNLFIR